MIIISCYNPDTKRTSQDEEILTTLLASLINYRRVTSAAKRNSKTLVDRTYHEAQLNNVDVLIGSTFPLLGLTLTEVLDLTNKEES